MKKYRAIKKPRNFGQWSIEIFETEFQISYLYFVDFDTQEYAENYIKEILIPKERGEFDKILYGEWIDGSV